MRPMVVSDLMTHPVVSVEAHTSFKRIVALLEEYEIGSVPVVDADLCVIGVVSESDLLAKRQRRGTGVKASLFAGLLGRRNPARSASVTAQDVMSRSVVTVSRRQPVAVAARQLIEKKLRRLYVVDGSGKLVGVLAKRDVLRVFLRPDEEIKCVVEQDVLQRSLWADPAGVTARVEDGVVTLAGKIDRRSEVIRAGRLTETLPGVVAVRNQLRYDYDDVMLSED